MRFLSILTFCLLAFSTSAQYFSGEITFKTTIVPKGDVELDSTVTKQDGQISIYTIKAGRYKNAYLEDGEESYSYTYNNKGKRMYDVRKGEKYITYRDSRRGNSVNKSTTVHRDSVATILGYPCYLVHRDADYGYVRTYYSDSVRVDYESFQQHAVGSWYKELKKVNGSVTIKSIIEYETYTSIKEAIKIVRREVPDEEFALPELPTVASYQALDARVQLSPLSEAQIDCYQKALKRASKIKGSDEIHTTYMNFVVTESDQIKFVDVFNPDEFGYDVIAAEIMETCGLQFKAGKIGGVPVSSEVFFPIEFDR